MLVFGGDGIDTGGITPTNAGTHGFARAAAGRFIRQVCARSPAWVATSAGMTGNENG